MIKYALNCDNGHTFESWFRSADDFDEQARKALVECPACRSTHVTKAVMAPNVARRDRGEIAPVTPSQTDRSNSSMVLLDEQSKQLRAAVKELHEKIARTTVDVGDQFADQARRMHEGDLPSRAIRGQATMEEANTLWENGVPVLPIPHLPDEQN
jgi:hypothetical protein